MVGCGYYALVMGLLSPLALARFPTALVQNKGRALTCSDLSPAGGCPSPSPRLPLVALGPRAEAEIRAEPPTGEHRGEALYSLCGPNAFAPHTHTLKPNLQCDGVRKWELGPTFWWSEKWKHRLSDRLSELRVG